VVFQNFVLILELLIQGLPELQLQLVVVLETFLIIAVQLEVQLVLLVEL
jgi:hypothetical protein